MNERRLQTISAMLGCLAAAEGGLIASAVLHGQVNLQLDRPLTLSDFEELLAYCEVQRWAMGHEDTFGRKKWAITDNGVIARRKLNQG